MERHHGNTQASKASESGKLPYSVETPYGFRLDLDFLKYVDDIEKGRTIKRISIQRHSKGSRASTLPRHSNPSGYGYRPSLWGSTGALAPRSRLSDDHRRGSAARSHDYRSPLWPRGRTGRSDLEAEIREFDEQPLGEHIRPHLLRASSLPLTVLLRQGLEATEGPQRGHLGDRNKSCEDIFDSQESLHTQDGFILSRRLRDALEHVEKLEREVRVIPDLRAQICQLQEEKETLRSQIRPGSLDGSRQNDKSGAPYERRSRHDGTREWKMSTDLDELLTVTSLQAKVAVLEQKLYESELELRRVTGRRRQTESKSPNGQIANAGVRVHGERVPVDQEEQIAARSINGHLGDDAESPMEVSAATPDTSRVLRHITKIKRLLDQHWECCSAAEEAKSPEVLSLQQEMRGLVHILSSRSTQPGHDNGQTLAATQVEAEQEKTGTGEERQAIWSATGSGWPDGEAAASAKMKRQPPGKQMEDDTGGSEKVNADFMSACRFLNQHMDNIENPTNETRRALVVLFQDWFSTAAEENSVSSKVALYLREVQKATPSLLAFLINLADDNGNTVLHYSVSHCNYSIAALLLDTGVSDINFQNKAGYTAAMLASLTAPDKPGDMEVVRRLMEIGNVNTRSGQTGQTALHLAVRHGRAVMVDLLLSCGADANVQDAQGTTPLMFASERGYTHLARLLLERSRCDMTLTDQSGRTALGIAVLGSHSDTAALLQAKT
ncbi:KN motif and ankyrin repeat domain-containing protein 3-like isoform 1-T1 [Syngnathus typhle]